MSYQIVVEELGNCAVAKTLRSGRVIINSAGVFLFADLTNTGWQLSKELPSPEDNLALAAVIEANGGFDKTSVEVVKE